MNDDFGRPRRPQGLSEDKSKKPTIETKKGANPISFEAPHTYGTMNDKPPKQKRNKNPLVYFKNATKKQKIIGGIIIAVLLIAGVGGVYALNKHLNKEDKPVVTEPVKKEESKPTTEASKLTGMQISPELNKRPITGIMIENSPEARPQSSLNEAGVVYEAIAEGGITRFLSLYQESQPGYIGPVRSVRPYYVDFLAPYDASIVHAGGSAAGLAKVRDMGIKDIDHGANAGAFQRVNDRYAPHNLYTNMGELDKISSSHGYNSDQAKSLPRKEEQPTGQITARAIDLSISSPLYNVHYDYDQASNTYKRSMGGRPHTDQKSGQQLSPKVVVALSMAYSNSGIYSVYQTTGSGKAYIFQDGIVKEGTWSKASNTDQFTFADAAGAPMTLNVGQTWISIVRAPNAATYTP